MDLNTVYQFSLDKLFTDVTITFDDGQDQITHNLHKVVICSASPFFLAMFTNHLQESQVTSVTVHVDNSQIASDIVASFYGQKTKSLDITDWKYKLLEYKQLDYFGIKASPYFLYNIIIPPEEFELLLEVINISTGYHYKSLSKPISLDLHDKAIIQTLIRNIPDNFDLNIFPINLLEQMKHLIYPYYLVLVSGNYIWIHNYESSICYRELNQSYGIDLVCPINDSRIFITDSKFWKTKSWNIETGEIKHYDELSYASSMCYDSVHQYLITGTSQGVIMILDLVQDQVIKVIKCSGLRIRCIVLSPDCLKMTVSDGSKIMTFCTTTFKKIRCISNKIYEACYTPNGKKLITLGENIRVWDTLTGKFDRNVIHNDNMTLHGLQCYTDNEHILFVDPSYFLSSYSIVSGKYKKYLSNENGTSVCYSPNYANVIVGYNNGNIKIFDSNNQKFLRSFRQYSSSVNQINFIENSHQYQLKQKIELLLESRKLNK